MNNEELTRNLRKEILGHQFGLLYTLQKFAQHDDAEAKLMLACTDEDLERFKNADFATITAMATQSEIFPFSFPTIRNNKSVVNGFNVLLTCAERGSFQPFKILVEAERNALVGAELKRMVTCGEANHDL